MMLDMFLLGVAAGLVGYLTVRISYALWQIGVPVPAQM